MSKSTYFVQECPTCGRSLEIRVEYLGKRVACRHCRGELVASDPAAAPASASLTSSALLRRANELLELAALRSTAGQSSLLPSSCSAWLRSRGLAVGASSVTFVVRSDDYDSGILGEPIQRLSN